MSRTLLLTLLLPLVTTTSACPLFRHHDDNAPVVPAPRVQGRIIKESPRKVRVKIQPYIYTYELAWSERTDQFILAPSVPRMKPLERAPRVRIKMPARPGTKTEKTQKDGAVEGVKPEPAKTMRHKAPVHKPKRK
ncbi:MAG: hypothetical protein DRI92_04275 [Aquificota bacterium]|nr:MAG: hypothetical protein DRI92_04275 [Aquificota bacterium]